jgi:predicted ester cyclase
MSKTTRAENKEVVRRLYEVINQRNIDALPDFFAADGGTCGGQALEVMVSNPLLPGARLVPATTARLREREGKSAQSPEMDALLDFTRHMFSAFPDMQVTIDSMEAEGDSVVVHWSGQGTHRGEFLGMAPTGRAVPFSSTDYFTIRNGKISSHSGHPDTAQVLAALGQLPLTPMATLLSWSGGA